MKKIKKLKKKYTNKYIWTVTEKLALTIGYTEYKLKYA
jgi:hypothetical protein